MWYVVCVNVVCVWCVFMWVCECIVGVSCSVYLIKKLLNCYFHHRKAQFGRSEVTWCMWPVLSLTQPKLVDWINCRWCCDLLFLVFLFLLIDLD